MIIIPLNTDSPIYHWPWMTVVLIAVNSVIFVLTGGGSESSGWILQYGRGLHPLEWVAYNFFHFGWLHLIGNMIFLWGFGIVVEGKIGWWRYLLVYLTIGILGGAFIQILSLGREAGIDGIGGAGSSLVVFGLMAVSMVWAPKNELDVFVYFGLRPRTIEVSILTFGAWYIAEQLLCAWFSGFSMGSAFGHLVGALWGAAVGVAMLRLGWVDCENWDLFALWNGTLGQPVDAVRWQDHIEVTHSPNLTEEDSEESNTSKKPRKRFRPSIYLGSPKRHRRRLTVESADDAQATVSEPANVDGRRSMSEAALPTATLAALDRIRELIREGKPQAALMEYRKRLRIVDHWPLEANDLQGLANGLYKTKSWSEATSLMEEFIARFPAQADSMRIKLAAVYVEVNQRPQAALKLLDAIELSDFPKSVRRHVTQIRQQAQRQIDEGTLELEGTSW